MLAGVYILGAGVKDVAHLTLEAVETLAEVDLAIVLDFNGDLTNYLETVCRRVENLAALYREGKDRESIYKQVAKYIALKCDGNNRVAYVAAGNPIFLNAIVSNLVETCQASEIPYWLGPSVSSVDTILADLQLEIGDYGLVCYDASVFCHLRPMFDTQATLILFDVQAVECNTVIRTETPCEERIQRLAKTLLQYYPANADWYLCSSARSPGSESLVLTGKLTELVESRHNLCFGSLVFPGANTSMALNDWSRTGVARQTNSGLQHS